MLNRRQFVQFLSVGSLMFHPLVRKLVSLFEKKEEEKRIDAAIIYGFDRGIDGDYTAVSVGYFDADQQLHIIDQKVFKASPKLVISDWPTTVVDYFSELSKTVRWWQGELPVKGWPYA